MIGSEIFTVLLAALPHQRSSIETSHPMPTPARNKMCSVASEFASLQRPDFVQTTSLANSLKPNPTIRSNHRMDRLFALKLLSRLRSLSKRSRKLNPVSQCVNVAQNVLLQHSPAFPRLPAPQPPPTTSIAIRSMLLGRAVLTRLRNRRWKSWSRC